MKQKVYVKAGKGHKAYYRTQEVGRKEVEAVKNLWEMKLSDFEGLISGDKTELKEKYIKEFKLGRTDPHPELEKLISMMDEHMQNIRIPFYDDFVNEYHDASAHETSVWRALDGGERVPLKAMKDYPNIMEQYARWKKTEEDNPGKSWAKSGWDVGEVEGETKLWHMTKDKYDGIIKRVKGDYSDNPKDITDTMLNREYPGELDDVKRVAKARKVMFNNLPNEMKGGLSPETMDRRTHYKMVDLAKYKGKPISDEVKAEYPILFDDVPFKYEGINERVDEVINETLTEIRSTMGDYQFKGAISTIIGSSGKKIPADYMLMSEEERDLVKHGIDKVSGLIGSKLLNKIKEKDPIIFNYDEGLNRSNFSNDNDVINLDKEVVNVERDYVRSETMAHEYGHAIESIIPEINQLSQDFLKSRGEGEEATPLNKILSFYSEFEYTIVDNFVNPYIGKIYGDGSTEILSMGMGYMNSEYDIWQLYKNDPQYLGFIVSILSGKIGSD